MYLNYTNNTNTNNDDDDNNSDYIDLYCDDDEYYDEEYELGQENYLRKFTKESVYKDEANDGQEIICCPDHDAYAKKIGAYLPTETYDYHKEIIAPWKKIWLYDHSITFEEQDKTIRHANYYHDYLDAFMKKKFFDVFAVKPCEKCYDPTLISCDPVCIQPIVKSPLVKRTSMDCLLTNFNICVGRCIYDDDLADSHIVCGCYISPAGNKYREDCAPAFTRFLKVYNKENAQGQRHGWKHFMVLSEYAQILTEFVRWLNQAYPNIDIQASYDLFRHENRNNFMKIKFDVVSHFRYFMRKSFLIKAGLIEKNNFTEFPPVCR